MPSRAWRGEARVRFAHCDPAGIVFFPKWFEILHGLVEDWMEQALGLSHAAYVRQGIGLGYVHVEADYWKPGFDGDRLRATIIVERIGRKSVSLYVPIYKDAEPLLGARMVMVSTRLSALVSIAVPDELRAALVRYVDGCKEAG